MAISVVKTWTNTPGATTPEISLPAVNWADYRVKESEPNRCVLTNVTTPLGYDKTVTRERRLVNDIYAGTTVEKALWAASRKGVQIHQANRYLRKMYDPEDLSSIELALPSFVNISIGCVLNSNFLTSFLVEDIADAIACLREAQETLIQGGIDALVRGNLIPVGLTR